MTDFYIIGLNCPSSTVRSWSHSDFTCIEHRGHSPWFSTTGMATKQSQTESLASSTSRHFSAMIGLHREFNLTELDMLFDDNNGNEATSNRISSISDFTAFFSNDQSHRVSEWSRCTLNLYRESASNGAFSTAWWA